jgi:3-hydroxy acid dehydrogenase / malonic semialdehyde reductase
VLVLVTGATAGFGAEIARVFVRRGDRVIATGRRQERLDALATELGEGLRGAVLDVRDRAAITAFMKNLPPEWADIDVLVNNAGLALGLGPAQTSSLDDWEQVIDTNVRGATFMIHALLPGMVARGRGHIINLCSIASHVPYPGGHVYGASKAFIDQLSLNLRADLLGTPVRVTNIEPGLCGGTEFSNVRFHGDDAKAAKVYEGTDPLTPADIAETVRWVATLPAHVNINGIQMMPVCQSFGPTLVHRR